MSALKTIPVGIIVERHKAASQWIDYVWRPASAGGVPQTKPWTILSQDGDVTTFYAGAATIELFKSATTQYRDNLAGDQSLWVVLRPTESEPPYSLLAVTADPSEGEAFSETGADLVDVVPLPNNVREAMIDFVAEHHVEQSFFKRKRDRADPEALARRDPMKDGKEP
jgi:hypothetical protein